LPRVGFACRAELGLHLPNQSALKLSLLSIHPTFHSSNTLGFHEENGQKSKKLKKPLFRCAKKAKNREKSF
jgi:hypothetical protein